VDAGLSEAARGARNKNAAPWGGSRIRRQYSGRLSIWSIDETAVEEISPPARNPRQPG
jgi:hypothetical protein